MDTDEVFYLVGRVLDAEGRERTPRNVQTVLLDAAVAGGHIIPEEAAYDLAAADLAVATA